MKLPAAIRLFLLNSRDLLLSAGPLIVMAVVLLWLAYQWLKPTPPSRVVMLTGPEHSAYAELGERYQAALAKQGIDLILLPSTGSLDNADRLQRDDDEEAAPRAKSDALNANQEAPSFGFVQSGSLPPRLADAESDTLYSLGSLFYEPVWVFYREAAAQAHVGQRSLQYLRQFKGMRVDLGPDGSAAPGLFHHLLKANGMSLQDLVTSDLDLTPAVVALLNGKVDALVLVSSPEAQMVQLLLATPGIRLLDMPQAEAMTRRFPFFSHVVLPRGVVDPSRNLPARDVSLVAPTTTLVARGDAHPAVIQLLIQAAVEIHAPATWLAKKNAFPSPVFSDLPLAPEAKRFYTSGPPYLQRVLQRWTSFWLANLVDRMWVVVAALIALLIPLSRVVPPLYTYRVSKRIFRWYGPLRALESEWYEAVAKAGETAGEALAPVRETLLQRLEVMAQGIDQIDVPLSYGPQLYALKRHLDWVRRRVAGEGVSSLVADQTHRIEREALGAVGVDGHAHPGV